ncbi:MAG: peptide chain release factor 1 [Cyanobacteriota bacterium]|nr:peptide chain release factor 1 [Cyanobacteriota bacterium]
MNNPIRRFKQQPWLPLFQIAGVTALAILAVEFLFFLGLRASEVFARIVETFFAGPSGIILFLSAAIGVGVLGVYFCERYADRVYLNTGSLWAFVLCLMVTIAIKSLIPVPQLLVPFSYQTLIGIILGVFGKGRPYWGR